MRSSAHFNSLHYSLYSIWFHGPRQNVFVWRKHLVNLTEISEYIFALICWHCLNNLWSPRVVNSNAFCLVIGKIILFWINPEGRALDEQNTELMYFAVPILWRNIQRQLCVSFRADSYFVQSLRRLMGLWAFSSLLLYKVCLASSTYVSRNPRRS